MILFDVNAHNLVHLGHTTMLWYACSSVCIILDTLTLTSTNNSLHDLICTLNTVTLWEADQFLMQQAADSRQQTADSREQAACFKIFRNVFYVLESSFRTFENLDECNIIF